jgi:tRNA-intron endonuclease, archaea type
VSASVGPDATALVTDSGEAGGVYGRGFYGTPAEGGLRLDRFESVYLAETGRLGSVDERGRTLPWPSLFRRAARADPEFDVRYVVYRDLRQRGYVVRSSPPPLLFSVLPRGGILHKTPAKFWVTAQTERIPFELARLVGLAEQAQRAKKLLLVGLVDEESDLTYYRVRRPSASGSHAAGPLVPAADGWLSGDRVTVFDRAAVEHLGRAQAFGSRIGDRLELSLIEAETLRGRGELCIRQAASGRPVSPEQLIRRARRVEPAFDERLAVFRALRERGLIVKTGFKYGAHFRAYPRDPERSHARYLVQAVPADLAAPWPEIAGRIRVAQGVRKEFLFAWIDPTGGLCLLSLERVRP